MSTQVFFFGFICNCLNCNYHCGDQYLHLKFVFLQFTSSSSIFTLQTNLNLRGSFHFMAFRASSIAFIRLQPAILPSEDISTMIVYDKGVNKGFT